MDVHMGNCAIIPAEVIESNYELRVEQYTLIADSGGAGKHRGGLGLRADYRNISEKPLRFLSEAEQTNPKFAPAGLDGGGPGLSASLWLIGREGAERRLPSKGQGTAMTGEIVSLRAGGGGGYGLVSERSRVAVEHDVRAGLVTAEGARRDYGLEGLEELP
jgi:N-methylhydantoinase B